MVMKKNWVKLILDIAMAIVFALLFNHRVVTGLNFHEIAGLAIGVLFIVHILLNGFLEFPANYSAAKLKPRRKSGMSLMLCFYSVWPSFLFRGSVFLKSCFPAID